MCGPPGYMQRESTVELARACEGTYIFNDMMQRYESFVEDTEYGTHPLPYYMSTDP
jgi:hypothetical protein